MTENLPKNPEPPRLVISNAEKKPKKQRKPAKTEAERAQSYYDKRVGEGWKKIWVDPQTQQLALKLHGIQNIADAYYEATRQLAAEKGTTQLLEENNASFLKELREAEARERAAAVDLSAAQEAVLAAEAKARDTAQALDASQASCAASVARVGALEESLTTLRGRSLWHRLWNRI